MITDKVRDAHNSSGSHQNKNLLFLINEKSGQQKAGDLKEMLEEWATTNGFAHEFTELDCDDPIGQLIKDVEKHQPSILAAAGGDGTVQLAATAAHKTGVKLAIIPMGSANGMAVEFGLPKKVEDCLELIAKGRSQPVDLILINEEHYCIHLSDIGLNARLIKYFEESGVRGMLGYAKVLWRALVRHSKFGVELTTAKGELLQKPAYMVVLANATRYGTGALINPEGKLDDGLFELIIVKKLNVWEVLRAFFLHTPFNPRKVEVVATKSVTISSHHRIHFQVDGEYIGKVKQIQARIIPKAVEVLVPEQEN